MAGKRMEEPDSGREVDLSLAWIAIVSAHSDRGWPWRFPRSVHSLMVECVPQVYQTVVSNVSYCELSTFSSSWSPIGCDLSIHAFYRALSQNLRAVLNVTERIRLLSSILTWWSLFQRSVLSYCCRLLSYWLFIQACSCWHTCQRGTRLPVPSRGDTRDNTCFEGNEGVVAHWGRRRLHFRVWTPTEVRIPGAPKPSNLGRQPFSAPPELLPWIEPRSENR